MVRRKYEPQRRYREKQADQRGLVRLSIWVPESAREQVLEMAARLRKIAKQ